MHTNQRCQDHHAKYRGCSYALKVVIAQYLIGCSKADPVGSALPPVQLSVHVRELRTQRNDYLFKVCNLRRKVCGVFGSVLFGSVKHLGRAVVT
jgi:hypothetical protein